MTEDEQKKIFSKNLNYYIELSGKQQKEVAKELGISTTTFNTWCVGKIMPRMGKIQKIADYFCIQKTDLIDGKTLPLYSNINPVATQVLPMLGSVSCGKPKYINLERESYIQAGTEIRADFTLTASGDSMIGARIKDGDIVFIRKQSIVENGEIAAIGIGDEALLKRFYCYRDKGLLILKAENPKYEDLVFTGNEMNEVHILGKAVAFQSDVE